MSINLYNQQLGQISQALETCENEQDRANLISLQNDLKELISLENLEKENSDDEENFQLSRKVLHKLINEKCRAPFQMKGHSEDSYHNAFIADVLSDDDEEEVTVKVFFLNPTQDNMKACDYYFNDNCTFNDNCKYSHGESVKFARLKEYQSPNYKLLKRKSHVLVKTETLWKPGSVIECSQDLKTCQVKLHGSGKSFDCPFSDVLPPLESGSDSSDLSTDDETDDGDTTVSNVLLINDNFGEWEKYTTGIGSKILQKYGYRNGEGLGIRKDGIIQPISAKIYVQGKSLDYNMELNESKKGQGTVEEKLKRQRLKQQKRNEKNYSRPENEVFSFLNNTICNIKPSSSKPNLPKSEDVKSQSKNQLNISVFKIEEDIKKVNVALQKLTESMKRHSDNPGVSKNYQRQIDEQQRSLEKLQRTLSDVHKEQKTRKEKSKLTIF